MKVLNLYAGIGGNRKLWPKDVSVTAVENNPEILKIYQKLFPNDIAIEADAHQYLLDHYSEFDFIWSSPPCPTHSRTNTFLNAQGIIRYPDMRLYQEIVFLKHWFKGKWIVENVISYYEPLIKPQLIDRHYFWSNFKINYIKLDRAFNILNARKSTRTTQKDSLEELRAFHQIDISEFKPKNELLLMRNCVNPILGLSIFNDAFKTKQEVLA